MSTTASQTPAPFHAMIEDYLHDGFHVGSPPWVDRADLLIDVEVAGELTCERCRHKGLKACPMHRTGGRQGYVVVAWCASCGHSDVI